MDRKSGVLMHISSLPGEFSCGAFSENAREFVDFLSDCGFTYWQTLPFCPVDEYGSPYKSVSAFAGNMNFIDIRLLFEKNLITKEELEESRQETPYAAEFARLYTHRTALMRKACRRADDELRKKINFFAEENPYIDKYCRFMALKERNNELEWQKWTDTEFDSETEFMHRFIQYEFFVQWLGLKKYANEKGIKLIGDIPIYVSSDSADTWGDKSQFLLDEKGYPNQVAGVPPDYFSEDGQLWGNPLYNFDVMEKDGFGWWKDRMRHMLMMFDGVRIDHFRAFEAFWSVSSDAKSAKEGKWIKGPGMKLIGEFKKLIDEFKELGSERLIIAEDLGDITDGVRKLVEESGFPGMRVFQFGFLSDGDSIHKPHNYINNSVAYSGTHDNNTLLGYLWELEAGLKKQMLEYCGYTSEDWERGYENIIRMIMASASGITIFPIQDLLRYGNDTRINTPGRAEGNWTYRVVKEQINSIDRNYWKKLNIMYSRI